MSDWQVGDLAVCVDARVNPTITRPGGLVEGATYRVARVLPSSGARHSLYGVADCGLVLEGMVTSAANGAFASQRFRKVRPDKHEGEASDWSLIVERFGTKRKVPTETIVTVDRDGRAYLRDAA